MSDLLDRYLACWNETDADARWQLLLDHWSDDLTYVDPLVEMMDIRDASRMYEANLNMIDAARNMTSRALDLLRK